MRPAPKPVHKRAKRKRTNARREIEKRTEKRVRDIVFWRDGNECCEKALDGARCGGGLQWGHVVARSRSSWLKLTIENTRVQCANHNLIHHLGDPTLFIVVGEYRLGKLRDEMQAHRGQKPTAEDLKCRLEVYDMLLEHRPSVFNKERLEALGYYGA